MKMLAVDIGNSNIKCGVIENGEVIEHWFDETSNTETVGRELQNKVPALPLTLCSVVPQATEVFEKSFRRAAVKVTSDLQNEVSGFYAGFGADRVADAVAGKILYSAGKNLVVVSLGTATVLTAVTANGQFKGGLITLGLGTCMQALSNRVPALPAVNLSFDEVPSLGLNTVASMHNGTLLAHLGALERWISCAKNSLPGPTVIIATGGWSKLLSERHSLFDCVDPFLTLKGTYFIGVEALKQKSLQ